MGNIMDYSQVQFFNSVTEPIKSATDKEAFFDNVLNGSGSITLEVSKADAITLEVYGCTRVFDKDGKPLKDDEKSWSKIALFNLKNFKKTEGLIDSNGIYCIPIEGCLSVKLKLVSLSSAEGACIVGAIK